MRGLAPGRTDASLRELLARSDSFVVPGVFDAISARIVERAGFHACYLTGAGIANAQFGLPDVGLISMSEVVEHVRRVADAVDIPVLADGDTGHGGPLSVMRTVHIFEQAGAAGIQLEDQTNPKRCGHFDGTSVVSEHDMVTRIQAAVTARSSSDFVIVARTDAVAEEGINRAVDRAKLYADAGADVLFVEAPRSVEELTFIGDQLRDHSLLVNVVEGGKTPELPADELEALGFSMILHANMLLRVMLRAGTVALEHLSRTGETLSLHKQMVSWDERQELVNLKAAQVLEEDLERHE